MIGFTRSAKLQDFERRIMPHLDAAYSLARFLMRKEEDAEDVVQEACLRAFRFFDGFRGENSRAWFLSIVRNTAFTLLKRHGRDEKDVAFEEELHTPEQAEPEVAAKLDRKFDQQTVRAAIDELPEEFREVIILRELEDCSYKEIAGIANIPVGTVMSRLARARQQLGMILSRDYPERAP